MQGRTKLLLLTHSNNVLTLLLCIVYGISSKGGYASFGPNDHLSIMGIPINTILRYVIIVAVLIVVKIFTQYRQNVIYPWITNTIYDHKEQGMGEWTKQSAMYVALTNMMSDEIYYIILINSYIQQLDIALYLFVSVSLVNFMTLHGYIKMKNEEYAPVMP